MTIHEEIEQAEHAEKRAARAHSLAKAHTDMCRNRFNTTRRSYSNASASQGDRQIAHRKAKIELGGLRKLRESMGEATKSVVSVPTKHDTTYDLGRDYWINRGLQASSCYCGICNRNRKRSRFNRAGSDDAREEARRLSTPEHDIMLLAGLLRDTPILTQGHRCALLDRLAQAYAAVAGKEVAL